MLNRPSKQILHFEYFGFYPLLNPRRQCFSYFSLSDVKQNPWIQRMKQVFRRHPSSLWLSLTASDWGQLIHLDPVERPPFVYAPSVERRNSQKRRLDHHWAVAWEGVLEAEYAHSLRQWKNSDSTHGCFLLSSGYALHLPTVLKVLNVLKLPHFWLTFGAISLAYGQQEYCDQ